MSCECRSTLKCGACNGRHHITICTQGSAVGNAGTPTNNVGRTTDQLQGTAQPSRAAVTTPVTTSSMSCIVTKIPVLLQTATTQVFRANNSNMRTNARIMEPAILCYQQPSKAIVKM